MKLAVLSDIHGNHYALDRILSRAKSDGVDQLLILGDFVGYYYHPEKVLKMLDDWKYIAIRGNHEEILKGLIEGDLDGDAIRLKYGSGHDLAMEKLSQAQKDFLIDLPDQLTLQIDNISLMMAHGSPWDKDFYLYPDCDTKILDRCVYDGIDFILTGHSHYAFCRSRKNTTLINVGSVGQSRNQSGLAQWTVLNSITGAFEMRSTPYDVSGLLTEVCLIDSHNNYLKDVLIRNNLDGI